MRETDEVKVKRNYTIYEATLADGDVVYYVDIFYRQEDGTNFFSDRLGPFSTRWGVLTELKRRRRAKIMGQRVIHNLDDDEVDRELNTE